ncbi:MULTISPECIES: hypothetical protein [unclassified Bradyrhizobium]|nr:MULTISPECIES: hypothetical protein [unclassified Bradyrhizobium]
MSYVADELTAAPAAGPSPLRRLRALLKAIVSRIDLSHFPRSCCS